MTQNDISSLIENQISSNSRKASIEDNNILHNFDDVNSSINILTESEKLETLSKHINRKDSKFDLHELVKLRKDYENNSIIDYLNINHLSIKIDYLREICSESSIYILCIDKTKLDSSYPDAQFEIPGYQYLPYRRDRNKHRSGKIVFLRKGLITKRVKASERDILEMICLEVTTSKKSLIYNVCLSTSI